MLVYLEGDKPPPPRHAEFRQTFLENLAKSQLEFEEVRKTLYEVFKSRLLSISPCTSGGLPNRLSRLKLPGLGFRYRPVIL